MKSDTQEAYVGWDQSEGSVEQGIWHRKSWVQVLAYL